jgi:hypothetical protein
MPTTRSRRRSTWEKLGARTRAMLQYLNDGVVMDEADLSTLIWPTAVSRQAQAECFGRWQAEQYLQVVHTPEGRCVQLGRRGARLLRAAGFPSIAPVRIVADRVRPGMLLANRFATALYDDLRTEAGVTGIAWTLRPFSGSGARGDGLAAVRYQLDLVPAPLVNHDRTAPELLGPTYTPPAGQSVQRLIIEIDRGTEDTRQLAQRACNWRTRWDSTTWPPATHAVFLWITTGGSARLETIWRAWTQHALLPAFFTTVDTLILGTSGHWHPWNPRRILPNGQTVWVWRDMYGRPRSLRPWDLEEGVLRFEQPVPVLQTSLADAVLYISSRT